MTSVSDSTTIPAPIAGQWLTERAQHATRQLTDCVEWSPDKLGGTPVLKSSRISVAQILAELGRGQSVEDVAEDFEPDVRLVKQFVQGLAV